MERGRTARGGERGGILAALMAGLAIAAILSGIAFQAWADFVRRDNEAEMIFRAQEISRALRKYRRDRGQLPVKLEDLAEPGSRTQYFLRHLYKDPLVRGGKWGLLYVGPAGGVIDPNAPVADSGLDPAPVGGLAGTPSPVAGAGSVPLTGAGSAPSSLAGGTEVTGLPIAGVRTLCKEKPFRRYRDHEEYAEWQFTVMDLEPKQQGQPAGQGNPPPSEPPPPPPQ